MKATASPIPQAAVAEKGWAAIAADLFKARLTGLVLLTTMAGFYLGSPANPDYGLLLRAILGTALLASGAAALNQLFERDYDALMRRTKERPLPSGQLQPQTVLVVGWTMLGAGLSVLLLTVNLAACTVGAVTALTYLFIYTPLKRKTWLNTLVGAVPGALPPVIGWTAAQGRITPEAIAIFCIQAFWQIPHFMAIAWLYRDDYAEGGFKMLPVLDRDGRRTGRQAVLYACLLIPASLAPLLLGLTGTLYAVSALTLSLAFAACAFWFSRRRALTAARVLFLVSVAYLPLLFSIMVLDKAPR